MIVGGWLVHAGTAQRVVAHHTSLWAIIVSVGVVLGVLAAILQVSSWVGRWRYRDAERRLLAAAATELNAEEAQRSFEKYQVLRDDLRQQVEDEVPREARRVFLRARSEMLASHLEEYLQVEKELAVLENRSPTILDHRLRGVIERSIRPAYLRRRRAERVALVLLVLLVVSSASPWSAAYLLKAYVELMNDPASRSDWHVACAIAAGIVVCAAVGFVVAAWWRGRSSTMRFGRRFAVSAGGIALVGCVVALTVGLLARQSSQIAEFASYEAPSALAETAASMQAQHESIRASVFISASTPLVGLLLGGLVAAGWPPRIAPKRRTRRTTTDH